MFSLLYDLGATLYIPNPSEARSPEHLTQWLEQKCHNSSPPHPGARPTAVNQRRRSLAVGAPGVFRRRCSHHAEMVASIRRLAPNATVGSFYGATETQRAVGYFEIANDPPAAESQSNKTIPLGRGIKDVQLLVLNQERTVGRHRRTRRNLCAQSSLGRRLHRRRTSEPSKCSSSIRSPTIRRTASIEPANLDDIYRTATSNGPAATTAE